MKTATKECNVPGCDERQKKGGVCAKHLKENYALACVEDGCEREVFAKGRCKAHYNRRWKKKAGKNVTTPLSAPVRAWGEEKFDVFTRISADDAKVILKAAGRPKGMYKKANEILSAWASRHRAEVMGDK